jgi:UDP-glucose 4-epimerase
MGTKNRNSCQKLEYDFFMTRILLTGAAGFIGTSLTSSLLARGEEVFTTDLLGLPSDRHVSCDIQSAELKDFVERIKPEVIVHLAAQIDVRHSMTDPILDLKVNALGTLNLLDAALGNGCRNFIYIHSGGAIYDSSSPMPLTEESDVLPASPYGASKLIAEHYVRILCSNKGVNWSSLALSNCYGPINLNKKGVIYEFWRALSADITPHINGPENSRDFIYISDVIEAIEMAIKKPSNSRVNVSSESEITLIDLYNMISDVMKIDKLPIIGPKIPGEVTRSTLSNKKALELWGWAPRVSISEGLQLSVRN